MDDTAATLKTNLRALMRHHKLTIQDVVTLAKRANLAVSNGTVGRVHKGIYVGTALLEPLAAVFGLKLWQFMVPGLDPASPPLLVAESAKMRAMFDTIRKTNEAITGALREEGNTSPVPLDTSVLPLSGQGHKGPRLVTGKTSTKKKAKTK